MLRHRKTLVQIEKREEWPSSRLPKNIYYKCKSSLMFFLILQYSLLLKSFCGVRLLQVILQNRY